MKGLEKNTFVVTGASDGIGHAIAARLIEEGATVINAEEVSVNGDPGVVYKAAELDVPCLQF